MITAYFLIATFLGGWFGGYAWAAGEKWTAWEFAMVLALCIGWPYLGFVLFKMWREGKL